LARKPALSLSMLVMSRGMRVKVPLVTAVVSVSYGDLAIRPVQPVWRNQGASSVGQNSILGWQRGGYDD